MRKKEINGIINDLLDLRCWRNPIFHVWIGKKVVFDLLQGSSNIEDEDSVIELLGERRKWFLNRIKELGGDLKRFEKVEFFIYGKKESVKIIYDGETFEREEIR